MIITEQEAKTKWCPESRARAEHSNGDAPTTVNRHHGETIFSRTRCLGSACMAWRVSVSKYPEHADGQPIPRGYCGKAGRP